MKASSNQMEALCSKLRTLVQDCLAKHLYESAIFYADKLATMSNQAPRDVYLLAQVGQLNKMEWHRSLFCQFAASRAS